MTVMLLRQEQPSNVTVTFGRRPEASPSTTSGGTPIPVAVRPES